MVKEDKKIDEEDEEESGLEENIEESEEIIDDNQFHEFFIPTTEKTSPVLERIESPIQESLEQNIGFIPQNTQENENQKNDTKYSLADYETMGEELRKMKNEEMIVKQIEPIRMESLGKDLRPNIREIDIINPELQELRNRGSSLEKDYIAKAEKLEKSEIKLPFQQEERKYKGRPI